MPTQTSGRPSTHPKIHINTNHNSPTHHRLFATNINTEILDSVNLYDLPPRHQDLCTISKLNKGTCTCTCTANAIYTGERTKWKQTESIEHYDNQLKCSFWAKPTRTLSPRMAHRPEKPRTFSSSSTSSLKEFRVAYREKKRLAIGAVIRCTMARKTKCLKH
jgi:hypothetical protein